MITIITVGKIKEKYIREGIDEYLKRLTKYAKIELIELDDECFDKEKTLKDWQNEFDKDINSVVNDPMFVDYENKNFNLKEGSPAYKIGFIDIDTSNVGIRK